MDAIDMYGKPKVQGIKVNQYSTTPVKWSFVDEDIEKFNSVYQCALNSNMNSLIRTNTGALSSGREGKNNRFAWDLYVNRAGLRLTVCRDGKTYVFKVGKVTKFEGKEIQPYRAWKIFVDELAKDNIDICDYIIDNGMEVKDDIPMPLILFKEYDTVFENAHHIDFHSSYPAGLANTHPEFRPTIKRLYNLREEKPEYKAVLNYSIGCMQSTKPQWQARWANLAKDAISDNLKRVIGMSTHLMIMGRKILGYNTDGIWYQGDIYHGDGEGDDLGEWSNDHINCTLRAKSNGAYEFIEDGVYTPVVRGYCKLDNIKDRSKWKWGDIYRTDAEIINYHFEEGRGIIKDE